jgi:hypothetical protein
MARAAVLAAAAVALTVSMVTPASAGAVTRDCDGLADRNFGSVVGYVEAAGAGTYDAGASATCGVLGVRGYYTHVGGASWTAWKYSSWGGGSATIYTKNLTKAQHSASVMSLNFYSYR